MKFTLTINQAGATIAGLAGKLDIIDLAIFDAFKDFANGNRCEKKFEQNRVWFWISYQALVKEIPFVPIKTKDAVYRRMKKLAEANIIEFHPGNQKTGKAFFAWAANYDHLNGRDFTEDELKMLRPKPTDEKPYPYGRASVPPTDEKPYNQYTKDQRTKPIEKDMSAQTADGLPEKPSLDAKEKKEERAHRPATPKPDPWTKTAAALFDRVNAEEHTAAHMEAEPFNWIAGSGRQFAALKKIRLAMAEDIQKKKHAPPTEEDFSTGFEFLFRHGFRYLKRIAEQKGGQIQFTPTTIENNYNQILKYGKQTIGGRDAKRDAEQQRDADDLEDLLRMALAKDFGPAIHSEPIQHRNHF